MFIQWVLLLFVIGTLDADYVRSTCQIPRLNHGRVKTRQRSRLAQFICLPHYTLLGNKYATCKDGEWDVPLPVCIRPGCKVQNVENSLHMTNFDDAWVTYFCLPGHKLVGSHILYCDGRRWNASAPSCVDSTTVSALSCDFESPSICGWSQDELHDFDWIRLNKKTPSTFLMTGPSYDHTYGKGGSGYYMYIESTSRLENDTARLISPVYDSSRSKNACFSFYYHMYGNSTGGLRVYQKPDTLELQSLLNNSPESKRYILFEQWRNLGDYWFNSVAPLTELETNFQIIIEGIRGSSFTSDIAIDDVAILYGENCTAAILTASTPPPYRSDSCGNRCFLSTTVYSVSCSCSYECVLYDNCCLDFFETCVFDNTRTLPDDMVSDSTDIVPQTQKLIASVNETTPDSNTASTTTTTTTPKPTTTTPKPTTTTPKPTTTTPKPTTTTPKPTTITPKPTIITPIPTTTTPKPTTITTQKPTTTTTTTTSKPTAIKTTTTTTSKPTAIKTTQKPNTTTTATTTTTTKRTPSTTSTERTTIRTTTRKIITIKPTIVKTTSTEKATTLAVPKSTGNPKPPNTDKEKMKNEIESRKVEHGPGKSEEHSSAWKLLLIIVGVIAIAAVVSLATMARSTRGRIALAKLRGQVSNNDSEVRYLPTDVDDDGINY